MNIKKIGRIVWGQDGAIFGGFLFRFGNFGECFVYDLEELKNGDANVETKPFSTFTLDKASLIAPHSNSVCFGAEFFAENDEFPLLYSNVYNNYKNAEDPLKGVTCVYRLQRKGREFSSTLVQIVQVGFVEDPLWCSSFADIRPYGNVAIDRDKGLYYAFTMRDESQKTRYFVFDLPKIGDGEWDAKFGVLKAVLKKSNVKEYFDCDYQRFIQGACCYGNKIYSLEGFTDSVENPAGLRVVNLEKKVQERFVDLVALDLSIEPEFIEFYDDVCYYCNGQGYLYTVEFED